MYLAILWFMLLLMRLLIFVYGLAEIMS